MQAWGWRARPGVSLLEVLVAVGASAIILLAMGAFISGAFTSTNKAKDKAFAQAKATQMLEEVLAYTPTSATDDISRFHDEGVVFRLTTANVLPSDKLSGNPPQTGGSFYRYVRQIDITAVPGDSKSRQVTVKVWYARKSTTPTIEGTTPVAVATGMARSANTIAGSAQVVDIYALSLENVPYVYRDDSDGDHQYLTNMRDVRKAFEASLGRIESANPWLKFKVTYVQRLSTGRDPNYRPYMNDNKPVHGTSAARDPLNFAYFYPGKISGSTYYYHPDDIEGKLQVDRGGTVTNQGDYILADQYNHCVRYAEETTSNTSHTAYGTPKIPSSYPSGSNISQLSLRQFLEDLLSDTTDKYRNAMLVNLHGELFPALALRNYADPAKVPEETDATNRERRVVTHPYKLNFDAGEPVTLLTHAWYEGGAYEPSDTSSDSGRNAKVFSGLTAEDDETRAAIVIRDIASYIDDTSFLGVDGTADYQDVKVSVVQRERTDTSTTNAKYIMADCEPSGLLSGVTGENAALRKNHSGPHVGTHGSGIHSNHTGNKPYHHGLDNWGDHGHFTTLVPSATVNDLVIVASDLRYDARATTDGTSLWGIKEASGVMDRDYGLWQRAYFPDPYLPFMNLANAHTDPRNTAQVLSQFRLKASAVGKRFLVETYVFDDDENAQHDEPEGVSKTYFYYGHTWDTTKHLYWDSTNNRPSIPWTDQVQLVGDPRHNPYLDMRKYGLVNRYFSNFTAGQKMYFKDDLDNTTGDAAKCLDAVNPLIAAHYSTVGGPPADGTAFDISIAGSANSWNGMKYNAPEYFRMWREALMRNGMTFVNVTGEPLGLLGLGGEFKLDGELDAIAALSVSAKPYSTGGSASDAGDAANELFPGTNSGARHIVRAGTSDGHLWVGLPWLGELFPSYADTAITGTVKWGTVGNLPSGRGAANVFFRQTVNNLPDTGATGIWSYATDKTLAADGRRLLNNQGLASFLNATAISGGAPADVDETGTATGTKTSTGAAMASAFRMNLPGSFDAKFSYTIDSGEQPPEWTIAPYSNKQGLAWLLPSTVSPRQYFHHESASSSHAAVAPLLIKDNFSGPPNVAAVVVPSTMRTKSTTQLEEVFDVANTAALEAVFDFTRTSLGPKNQKGLPRVRITAPAPGAVITSGKSAIPLTWYGKWTRADGRPYSAFYGDTHTYPFDPATGEPLDVVFFVKYRKAEGSTWKTATLSNGSGEITLEAGLPTTSTSVTPIASVTNPDTGTTYATKNSLTWDASSLSNGSYVVRVEAYRSLDVTDRNKTLGGCYAYQEIDVTLN